MMCRLEMDKSALQTACNDEAEGRRMDRVAHLEKAAVSAETIAALKVTHLAH